MQLSTSFPASQANREMQSEEQNALDVARESYYKLIQENCSKALRLLG